MTVPFRIAKIMKAGSQEVDFLGFVRGQWVWPSFSRTLRVIEFHGKSLDPYPIPGGYGRYAIVGAAVPLLIDKITGFMWAPEDQATEYFKQAYEEIN